jgi:hypothetical protein
MSGLACREQSEELRLISLSGDANHHHLRGNRVAKAKKKWLAVCVTVFCTGYLRYF